MAEYATSIEIEASPEEVFEYLVTPDGMTAWMGHRADLDPYPDGVFGVDIAGSPIRGQYLKVDRPDRVVVSWGVAGSAEFPPGESRVRFTLTPTAHGNGGSLDMSQPHRQVRLRIVVNLVPTHIVAQVRVLRTCTRPFIHHADHCRSQPRRHPSKG